MLKDRVTWWNPTSNKHILPQGKGAWRRIADRLGAYEDTGLTPEEIEEMKKELNHDKSTRYHQSGFLSHSDLD